MVAPLLIALTAVFGPAVAASPPPPPNVVLIVVDDLGYGDLGCYDGTLCPTPNIDALAASGVRFTQGYSNSCLCAPSRAGLLTGKYPNRFGFEYNPGEGAMTNPVIGLPLSEPTLAERLKVQSYSTALIGKWHLGSQAGKTPMDRGFDRFFGIYGGGSDYLPGGKINLWDNRTKVQLTQYATDEFTDQAVDFVEGAAPQTPFFLFLSYTSVHVPYQAPQQYLDRVPNLTGDRQLYAAMLTAVDDGIGRVLDVLADRNLEQDTLVVFASDNGGAVKYGVASNGILRSGKETFFEGGVRVPLVLSWPGQFGTQQTFTRQSSLMDIAPTILTAAGAAPNGSEGFDGVDLAPYVQGVNLDPPHEQLFWRKGNLKAVRDQEMKWMTEVDEFEQVKFRLFDLDTDVSERKNLRRQLPEEELRLRQVFRSWSRQMMDPLWIP